MAKVVVLVAEAISNGYSKIEFQSYLALYYKEISILWQILYIEIAQTHTHSLFLSLSLCVCVCVCLLLTAAVARPLAGLGFPHPGDGEAALLQPFVGRRDEDFLLLMARQFRCSHLSERG
ncbi:hypothetical protein M6B38_318335 [Iris pallida]|uniref:Uncharacterized protein n=1 Tax=Iris pallida TaxID=29817 RepID=A0AAX6HC82_IRIPA|nr:hypothetical protein M6B38_318335 [Iris pallida]